eukprot:4705476-Prymnesium_polylepis.1
MGAPWLWVSWHAPPSPPRLPRRQSVQSLQSAPSLQAVPSVPPAHLHRRTSHVDMRRVQRAPCEGDEARPEVGRAQRGGNARLDREQPAHGAEHSDGRLALV